MQCQTRIFNLYGITEVSSWATYYQVDLALNGCIVPLGTPITDTFLELRDANGLRTNQGTGILWIGTQNMSPL